MRRRGVAIVLSTWNVLHDLQFWDGTQFLAQVLDTSKYAVNLRSSVVNERLKPLPT